MLYSLGLQWDSYYIVIDTATDHGVEGFDYETWAQHRADNLNRQQKGERECTNVSIAGCPP